MIFFLIKTMGLESLLRKRILTSMLFTKLHAIAMRWFPMAKGALSLDLHAMFIYRSK